MSFLNKSLTRIHHYVTLKIILKSQYDFSKEGEEHQEQDFLKRNLFANLQFLQVANAMSIQ